jgi:raffinose synthase
MDNSTTNLFKGNNTLFCSAMNNDFILNANRDSVSRNSHDYFPNIPASHGEHIAANAHNSFWTGEFVIPDWDMFESGHYSGAFHAASRAISGGPIYLSDKLGKHNFSVLKKLSFADSRTPVSLSWGKPTLDSFFIDPATDRAPIKIFNQNKTNYVVGAFNTYYDKSKAVTVRGYVSPRDIPGLTGEQFAIYSHQKQSLVLLSKNTEEQVILDDLGFDIFTIAPVNAGFAPIGLADKYNSGATITDYQSKKNTKTITLMGKGHFIAYSDKTPKKVLVNGKKVAFEYNQYTSVLSVDINSGGDPELKIIF